MLKDECLLAFDFGIAKVGVAIGNTLTGLARPLTVILTPTKAKRFEHISDLINVWQPDRLVVGLSLDKEGLEQEMTRACLNFANQLKGRYYLPVELVDERYSSIEAQALVPVRERDQEDAYAAAVILQRYLSGVAQ